MRQVRRAIRYLSGGARTGPAAMAVLSAAAVRAVMSGPAGRQSARAAVRATAATHRHRADRFVGEPAASHAPDARAASAWLAAQAVVGLPLALAGWLLAAVAVGGLATPVVWWSLPAGESFTFILPVTDRASALTGPPLLAAAALVLLRWGVPAVAGAHARLCRALLAPEAETPLAARVRELTTTRAGALDAHAAELRRIERDLHDGAQARLVSIAIHLAVAQQQRVPAPHLADQLVERARAGVEEALSQLRAVARGLCPPILADRGLSGAVHALVADCPVPVRLAAGPLTRLPAAVEGAAYFVVAEALANVARHSTATAGTVELDQTRDRLAVTVTDDGRGGADEARGTGLAGMRRRVAALDGRVTVSSPPGGPTTVRAELPCAS